MTAAPPSARAILRERPFWLLLLLVILFFFEPLTTGTFYARDIYLLFYGHKAFLADALRHGHIPLWDPLMHAGQPFLAQPANSFYYPSTLLFLIFPPLIAFNVANVLQYVLCAATAYFLARTLRLSPWAAFVSAAAYAFCGYTLSAANLTVLVLGMPWPPLLLAATHRLIEESRSRWLVVAVMAGALPLFGGAAELTAMSFATAGLWSLLVLRVPFRRRAGLFLLAVGFAIALSAAQTYPAAEVIRNSSRSMKREYAAFVQWSVHPHRLPELVIPQFFGPTNRAARSEYWGGVFEMQYPYMLSIYFGVPLILLAGFGAVVGDVVSRRGRVLLAAIALGGFVLSLGGWLPFFSVIYDYVPLVSIFRFPVKAMLLGLVPISVLAGCGADALRLRRGALTFAAGTCGAVLLAFAALLASSAAFQHAFTAWMFLHALPPGQAAALARNFAHAGVAAALLALVAGWERLQADRLVIAVAVVVTADLVIAGVPVNAYAPREIFDKPPLANAVQRLTANGGRLWRAQSPYTIRINPPTPDAVWVAWYELQLLGRYTAATFGIPTVFGDDYDGLAPLRESQAMPVVRKMPWPARLHVLSAAGVTAILTPDAIALPGVVIVGTYRDTDGKPLYLYANRAGRRIRFASVADEVRYDSEAFRLLASRPFDPQRVLITGSTGSTGSAHCDARSLMVKTLGSDAATVEVDTPCAGWVVFADTWYPGWKATVDGDEVPLQLADYAFSAVPVPAGRHTVRKVYRPRGVPIGFALSCIALVLLLGTAFAWRLRAVRTDSRIAPPE